MRQFNERLAALSYGPDDTLYLSVDWNDIAQCWQVCVCSKQRRGWVDFIGIVTATYHADTPDEAAKKAVAAVPEDWAYEPNQLQVRRVGDRGAVLEPVPMTRKAA